MKCAIILCSGGLDSVVSAHYAKKKLGYNIKILFFNYGQRNLEGERRCTQKCAEDLNCEFLEVDLDWLGEISGSLINKKGNVKKLNKKDLKNTREESKKWYVPCRNMIFINYALALAESFFVKEGKKFDVFVGFKNEGREFYPDATKEFVRKMNELSKISCTGKFRVIAPLIEKDKEDIVRLGMKIGVHFQDTFSCYVGPTKHCGECLACQLRKQGFYWANVADMTEYIKES